MDDSGESRICWLDGRCFIDDEHGLTSMDEIGVDNILVEADYPHTADRAERSHGSNVRGLKSPLLVLQSAVAV